MLRNSVHNLLYLYSKRKEVDMMERHLKYSSNDWLERNKKKFKRTKPE